MRITSAQLYTNSTSGIQAAKSSIATLQNQVSTGVALTKPSDDPVGMAQSLRLRTAQAANTQYAANITDGLGWLTTVDSTLSASENVLNKAIDLTVQGGDAALGASGKAAIATQLDALKADLLNQANTSYLGRSVFAGNSNQAAFTATSPYTWSGTAGSTVQRRVSATETVQVDADGSAAFGTGSTSVFATIDAISAALRANDANTDANVTAGLSALQTSLSSMTAVHAAVGSSYSRLTTAKTANVNTDTTLSAQRAGVENADLSKVIVELQAQQLNYQASLAVTAKVLQPSLMSYLS